MTSKRVREWLVAAAAGAVHGGFWFFVAREMRVDTAFGAGPLLLGLLAGVLGGVSVLAFFAARPLQPWSYAGVVAALVAGGFAVVFSEDMLGLDIESPLIPLAIGFLIATSLASYLVWMIAHPRWSVWILTVCAGFGGGVSAGIAIAEPPPPRDVYVEPDLGAVEFPEWKMGDVHVHAAGDRDLVKHPDCRRGDRFVEGIECARALVDITAAAAAKADAKWVILVEHGAWLSGGRDFDLEKGIEEWEHLRTAAEEIAPRSGVRMLMGEELGSAGVSFAGHFSAYSTPSYVPNSARRIPDIRYVEGVASLGGWGAINHPFQGGNKWDCWYPAEDCGEGVVGFAGPAADDPAAFRAIELTNGGRFPTKETLAMWDELLVQGYEVWGVGGSDAHSR
ncbi:MAG TPA: hypothetical protein VEU29_00835, partial [Actinomycetota bacterium]|nr:hypothetical protein [Actinomycetota bacterium]